MLKTPIHFKTFSIIALLISWSNVHGQDIETLLSANWLNATGSINAMHTYYRVTGKEAARKPFGYMISGSLNLTIKGVVQAPFTFLYSNLGSRLTQPSYNQTALHPKYKWVQLHLGRISQSWSAYTLNGHLFSGAGIELTPRNFNMSLCAGQFVKAINPVGPTSGSMVQPSFNRKGAGLKLGYNYHRKLVLNASTFYAADDTATYTTQALAQLTPKENICSNLQFTASPKSSLKLFADLGNSYLIEDRRMGSFKQTGLSQAAQYRAIKAGLETQLLGQIVTIGYERVDPGYRTLGAYYFNNDLENITLGTAIQLAKNKLQIQGNLGKQRDNLNAQNLSIMQRNVASANVAWQLNKRINLQGSWSNFLSFTNLRSFADYAATSTYQIWDTLNFRQIARNVNGVIVVNLKTDSLQRSALSIQCTAQNSADRRNGELQNGSLFLNGSAAWSRVQVKSNNRLAFVGHMAYTELGGFPVLNFGPSLTWGKALWGKKATWNSSVAYVKYKVGAAQQPALLNLRTGLSATWHKRHNLNVTALLLQKGRGAGKGHFRETTVSFQYGLLLSSK